VLCCLEGRTCDEAAQELGWSLGSVKGRLERGREVLRSRLVRRGLELTAALAATVLPQQGARGSVPARLLAATTRAAQSLASHSETAAAPISPEVSNLVQGAVRAMTLSRLEADLPRSPSR
jgi:hypothetical protein